MEASSSSALSFPCSYDVFLSFRGEDTRPTFTDHLYIALTQAAIHTFRDDDEIERGENIKKELDKAIEQSKVAVVVLSPNYASSRWCLDELVQINERKKARDGHIIPIFNHVDPSDVRRQKGSFGEGFARLEDRYKKQLDIVEKWKDTLKEVADLSGEVLNDRQQKEGCFIQNIVKLIRKKLSSKLLDVDSQLVGIDSYVKNINSWLQDEQTDVRILIVYGIGGVGKTTIAKTVFNQNYRQFERSCFLANVREESKQPKGVRHLQKQLLFDMGRSEKIYSGQGVDMIRDSICCRKVLIVIDDIDELKQFRQIIGRPEWLSSGSKIIITTRRKSLFNDRERFWNLNIKPLDDHNSLQLFNFHAFGGDSVPENLVEYSKCIVSHCGGLPLALSVLGSFLSSDKSIDLWKSALKELQAIPNGEVQKILKISYDSLENDSHQQLFLHIACFFIGEDQDFVIDILDGCEFQTKVGMKHLSDRCLITINERNRVEMHQLVRDMGREIVRKESDEPGERSRVWKNVEAFQVLTERTGTGTIKGLTFDMQMLKEDEHVKATSNVRNNSADMHAYQDNCLMFCSLGSFFLQLIMNCIRAMSSTSSDVIKIEAFARMRKLQILQLNNVEFGGGFKNFPKCLVWLRWHRFPLEYIPTSLHLEKLVVLDMRYSSLRHVFQGRQCSPCLRILDMSYSHLLTATPDFRGLPNLKRLILKNCINLVKIEESIGVLERLLLLNLKGCIKLKKLPRAIGRLRALQKLILIGCAELRSLPEEMVDMENLEVLLADGITLGDLHTPLRDERRIRWPSASGLFTRDGPKSNSFSLAIFPRCLTELSLPNCHLSDDAFPRDFNLPFLSRLNLGDNPFHTLPTEIFSGLPSLKYLDLSHCSNILSLPDIPKSLNETSLLDCTSITALPDVSSVRRCVLAVGCRSLFRVQNTFTFDYLTNIARNTFNVGIFGELQMEMVNCPAKEKITTTVKALQERGILSIFQGGCEIPGWYTYQGEGSSITFVLDTCDEDYKKIYGLNICVVFEAPNDWDEAEVESMKRYQPFLLVNSRHKCITWAYGPAFYPLRMRPLGMESTSSGTCTDMLWLSFWKFLNQLEHGDEFFNQLEHGDEVTVRVLMPPGFVVKRVGVHTVGVDEIHRGGTHRFWICYG